MSRSSSFLFVLLACVVALGCDSATQTATVDVQYDRTIDFTQFQTFSVVTQDLVDPPEDVPELGDEQEAFNRRVNQLIIQAMQAEPVCLDYIPTDQTSPENQPDLWAANGLARATEGGYVYDCCGGWWWGYWGWYWDPCAYLCPTYVEYDVGSLFVPVGLPPSQGAEPAAVFGGLVQALVGSGTPTQEQLEAAVNAIFEQWPDQRQCPE
jgi:hypothetical protein